MLQKRIDDQPSISREMIHEAQRILHQHLKRVGLKHTAQRDTILRIFLETREHLSTNELHRLVQKKNPRIGFTTVYRTLKLFTEAGLAREILLHDGQTRYEHALAGEHHDHLVCTGCNAIIEFEDETIEKLQKEIAARHGFMIRSHKLEIYGLCAACRDQR